MDVTGFARDPRRANAFGVEFASSSSVSGIDKGELREEVQLRLWHENAGHRRTMIIRMDPHEAARLTDDLSRRLKHLAEQRKQRLVGAHEADQENARLETRRQEAGGELKSERAARIGSTIGQLEDEHAGKCPGFPELAGEIHYIRTVSGFDQMRCEQCGKAFHVPVPKGCVGFKPGAAALGEEVGT